MKTTGTVLILASVTCALWMIVSAVRDNYVYDSTIGSYWNLSIKASSLDVKSRYLDQFIDAVKSADLSGNDSIFFPTPDNSYDQNFNALLSLQQRIHQWLGQDETSMAYQQAISQITSQEQDDNSSTISVINDLWWKKNHYFFWNLLWVLSEIVLPTVGVFGGSFLILASD